ncbi:hypothetical protein PQ455_07070 [Sphingomonas naphthae]|uniref:Uncharacterized protein n=1 Tax=Sphingomonas naphthae TaxID=1813468 RepID=A0ABY7TP09_9SPHN|nr:hypothetical protein [Sphingomonas naphthae]WCT74973.1 hypothetical protein PQ455_07070 [Sphingomonas naphthae]
METPPHDLPITNLQDAISCEWRRGVIVSVFGDGSRKVIRPVGAPRHRRRSFLRALLGLERRKRG